MYPDALAVINLPAPPRIAVAPVAPCRLYGDGAVERGILVCADCARRYRIRDGIADLLGTPPIFASPAQFTNTLPPTAWSYERIWRSRALTILSGEPFGYERELPLLTGLAEPARGGLILDIACSNGLYARALAEVPGTHQRTVIGIDHAMPMLRQARAYARAAGLQISYICAQAQALPFGSQSAATLVMGGSLNEIGDADRALHEMRRVGAPDVRHVQMALVQATTPAGRRLQAGLGFGGIAFPTLVELNRRFAVAGWRLRAQWRYRVVVFSLLT
ncbi:MAG: methyltransferase domain-containing protein [Oscillochloris sp.]|nr:methyltransferase domain-containing protein [Oscillochloris sp.]